MDQTTEVDEKRAQDERDAREAARRLADDSFCQLCGARGVRGRLCGGCERSA